LGDLAYSELVVLNTHARSLQAEERSARLRLVVSNVSALGADDLRGDNSANEPVRLGARAVQLDEIAKQQIFPEPTKQLA
jgi:hypothetical protein